MGEQKTIVVVGAGILGLATAIRLQSALPSHTIQILARDLPGDESINYTSPWAGAHHRSFPALTPVDTRARALYDVSFAELSATATAHPAAGVTLLDAIEYHADPSPAHTGLQGGYGDMPGFRVLGEEELPKGVGATWGCTYRTWCLNPVVYCAWLMRRFVLAGGKVERRALVSLQEAWVWKAGVQVSAVVNCSGVGFGDKDVYPIRGQTVLVSNPSPRTITQQHADGTWTFIIPRPLDGGTVVGGTKQPHDWAPAADPATRALILERAARLCPELLNADGGWDVVRDIVGRRPAREGGLRLEREVVPVGGGAGRKGLVVHAYGAGGSGYELSWGVGQEVVRMVREGAGVRALL